jgi:hypothetical protein
MATQSNGKSNLPKITDPAEQQKRVDAMVAAKKRNVANAKEFERLVEEDSVGALEFLAGELAILVYKETKRQQRKTDGIDKTYLDALGRLQATIKDINSYLALRSQEEAAADLFAAVDKRLENSDIYTLIPVDTGEKKTVHRQRKLIAGRTSLDTQKGEGSIPDELPAEAPEPSA